MTELWAFYKNIAHLAGASVSYGHISSFACFITMFLFLLYQLPKKKLKNLENTLQGKPYSDFLNLYRSTIVLFGQLCQNLWMLGIMIFVQWNVCNTIVTMASIDVQAVVIWPPKYLLLSMWLSINVAITVSLLGR